MKHIQILFLGIALWLPAAAVVASDPYLSALEAEADDTESRHIEATPRAATVTADIGADTIKTGLAVEDFESTLKSSYSGSYFLYVRLNASGRKAVYTQYQKDNRVESIREEIVRQLSSG